MFKTRVFLSDISETVPSYPPASAPVPIECCHAQLQRSESSVLWELTEHCPSAAIADYAPRDMLPAVCTKAVPVEGTDIIAKGPPPWLPNTGITSMAIEATGPASFFPCQRRTIFLCHLCVQYLCHGVPQ